MGTTPNFGFPFPDGGELIDASAVGDLANALDVHLDDFESTTNPTMITLTMATGWRAVTGGAAGDPVRLYRMGRLCTLLGEVIYETGTNGAQVPENRKTVATLPVGWRPATRVRTPTIRSSGVALAEVYINNTDGRIYIPDAQVWNSTPGYSLCCTWVTAI